MTKKLLAWHFSETTRLCRYDGREIVAGKTLTVALPLSMCNRGLHASVNILDACNYAPGPYIWRVELSGEVIEGDDKAVATKRKALWGYDATEVLRAFARKVALDAVEKYWDKKLGEFPAVTLQYLRTGDESLRLAAWSAAESAARSAAWFAAWSAARSAAWSAAESAAWSAAQSAAWSAAQSAAWSAARSAESAAESANAVTLEQMVLENRPKKIRKMDKA